MTAMTTYKAVPTDPVLYVLWHRAPGGKRWHKAGLTSTHAEALLLCRGSGDWHIAPLYNPALVPKAADPTSA